MKFKAEIVYVKEHKMGDKKVKSIFLFLPYFNRSDETYYWLEWVDMEYCWHFISFGRGMGWKKWRIIKK